MSLAILLSMGLTACGGGGSSGNNSSNADDTAASLQLGLQVIDGYVEGAICFGDVNRNGSRDAAEAWKTTDASGKAVLEIPESDLKDSSGNLADHVRVICEAASSQATDHIYGASTNLTQNTVFSREVFFDRNNPDAIYTITPFSTLADLTVAAGDHASLTSDAYTASLESVTAAAGVSRAVTDIDYNSDITNADGLRALVAGELLARNNVLPESAAALETRLESASTGTDSVTAEIAKYKSLIDSVYDGLASQESITGNDVITALNNASSDNPASPGENTDDPDNPGGSTDNPDNPGGSTDDPDNPGGNTDNPDNPGGSTDDPVVPPGPGGNDNPSGPDNPQGEDETEEPSDGTAVTKHDLFSSYTGEYGENLADPEAPQFNAVIYVNITEASVSLDGVNYQRLNDGDSFFGATVNGSLDDNGHSYVTVDLSGLEVPGLDEVIPQIVLSGTAENATIEFAGKKNAVIGLTLNGVDISSGAYPAIVVSPKTATAFITLKGDNYLTDGRVFGTGYSSANGVEFYDDNAASVDTSDEDLVKTAKWALGSSDNGTLSTNGTLRFSGDGRLTVSTGYKHGIYAKNRIYVYGGAIGVYNEGRNGLQSKNGFDMHGGTVYVEGAGTHTNKQSRGIIVSGDESADGAGLGGMTFTGGQVTINTVGKAISAKWDIEEDAETTDTADDPLPLITITGGNFAITTTGQIIDSDTSNYITYYDEDGVETYEKKSCSPEGIEGKYGVDISGGSFVINTTDDALNASRDGDGFISISGGQVFLNSSGADAIDSNGDINISGGTVLSVSTLGSEDGFDCDGKLTITGGILAGISGSSHEYASTGSATTTQNTFVIGSSYLGSRNTSMAVTNSAGTPVFALTLPDSSFSLATISAPELNDADTYSIHSGVTLTSGESFRGLYTEMPAFSGGSVTGTITTDSSAHVYTALSGSGMGPGGMFPGGNWGGTGPGGVPPGGNGSDTGTGGEPPSGNDGGTSPGSEPPSDNGGGTAPGGGSSGDITYEAATMITAAETQSGQTYASSAADVSALIISGAISADIVNPAVTKTGDSDGGDDCNFYGLNAAVLVKDSAIATITGGTISTQATGANAVFSYGGNGGQNGADGDGTTVIISDTVITTTGSGSGGIMTTGGGITKAENLTITTSGNSSAPIRTDRGGGEVYVSGGTYTSNGLGSPAIYSTAKVRVAEAVLVSNLSEGICIEGENSVELVNTVLTASNTKRNGNAQFLDTVMMYQSMSGDANSGQSEFTMTGGSIESKSGHVFHVTNTNAKITLNGVEITNSDPENILLSVSDDGWSGGSNSAALYASDQYLSGNIKVGSNSSLTLQLESSTFAGAIDGSIVNAAGTTVSSSAGTVAVTLADSSSVWELTGDSYVTSFTGNASQVYGNGYTLYVNGVALEGTN